VDIFNRTKSLLPQLELDTSIKLGETRIEMVLESIRVGKIDGMWLVGIFGNIRQMKPKSFAKASEFNFSLMLEAEFECLLCNLLKKSVKNMKKKDKNSLDIPGKLPRVAHCFLVFLVTCGNSPTKI